MRKLSEMMMKAFFGIFRHFKKKSAFPENNLILISYLKVEKKSSKSLHIWVLRRFFVYTLIKNYTKHHLKFGKNQADNLAYIGFRRRFFPVFYWCLVLVLSIRQNRRNNS